MSERFDEAVATVKDWTCVVMGHKWMDAPLGRLYITDPETHERTLNRYRSCVRCSGFEIVSTEPAP